MPVCTVNYQPPYLMPRLLRWPMQGTVAMATQNAALGWPPWTRPLWQQQQHGPGFGVAFGAWHVAPVQC